MTIAAVAMVAIGIIGPASAGNLLSPEAATELEKFKNHWMKIALNKKPFDANGLHFLTDHGLTGFQGQAAFEITGGSHNDQKYRYEMQLNALYKVSADGKATRAAFPKLVEDAKAGDILKMKASLHIKGDIMKDWTVELVGTTIAYLNDNTPLLPSANKGKYEALMKVTRDSIAAKFTPLVNEDEGDAWRGVE